MKLVLAGAILAVAIALAATILRRHRWFARIRKGIRRLREAATAIRSLESQAELLYQFARPVVLQAVPGASVFAGGSWSVVGGDGKGWQPDTFYKVRGLAIHDGRLFASLTGPKADGPQGEVWRLDGDAWTRMDVSHGRPSNKGPAFVDHLFSSAAGLLTAEKTGVWCLGPAGWSQLNGGLVVGESCGPYGFAEWNGRVVMGQWGQPRVAVLGDDAQWSYLPDPEGGWGNGVRTIYCLAAWNGYLYAGTGTGKLTGPGSMVWRYDGTRWEKVGGEGVRGSWMRGGVPFILSLTVYADRLVATLSRPPGQPQAASNVWVFDGDSWGALAAGATPALMAGSLIMNDAIAYRGRLVVATGHDTRKPAGIWELHEGRAWRSVGPVMLAAPGDGDGGWWIYRLCTDGGHLYASTAGHRGAARVLRFTPADPG